MAKPIRILQIGMTKNIGGLETYLMTQFDALDKDKIMYDFVNITSEDPIVFANHIEKMGGKIYGVKSRHSNPIRHYWQWYKLLRKIANNYEAIVLNSNSLTYVFPIFIAKWFGINKRIMHSHNAGFEQHIGRIKSFIISMNRKLLKWSATDYFACSNQAGIWMFGKDCQYKIIPNGINVDTFKLNPYVRSKIREELGIDDETFVVGHVGRFTYQKNHEFLIKIFYEIYQREPNSKLILVGGVAGDDIFWKRAHEQVSELGLEHAVLFLGMRDDISEVMQSFDTFVIPSYFEGFGIVAIEAQAVGVPIFVSDTIPRDIECTPQVSFISLDKPPIYWAEKVLEKKGERVNDATDWVKRKGFDIKTVIKDLEVYYQNIM